MNLSKIGISVIAVIAMTILFNSIDTDKTLQWTVSIPNNNRPKDSEFSKQKNDSIESTDEDVLSSDVRCRRGLDYTGRDLFRSLNKLMIPRPYDAFVKENCLYLIFLSRENRQGYDLKENNSDWKCTFQGSEEVDCLILNGIACMTGMHVQVIGCEVPRNVSKIWGSIDPRRELAQVVSVSAFSWKTRERFKYEKIEFCRYPPALEWRPPPIPSNSGALRYDNASRQSQTSSHAVQLAACTMLRHEYGRNADLVLEWLAYHTLQGVQHFYIMSNGDTRALRAILAPHLREGRVEVIDWEWELTSWVHQSPQVNVCLYRYRGLAKWVAMMDVDEFFQAPGNARTLRAFADAQNASAGAVCAPMYWFRALPLSSPEMQPTYRHLVTEDFVNRIPTRKLAVAKCLFRPENVVIAGVHGHCGGGPQLFADDSNGAGMRLAHYKTSGSVAMYLRALYGGPRGNVTVEDRSMAALNGTLRAELLRLYPGGVP